MLTNAFVFVAALFMLIKGATLATRSASRLASSFNLSEYAVGFFIVAIISILPETFISINAALAGVPSFGLGVLFGSNIADLTLVFVVIIFLSGRALRVESKILKNHALYPFVLLLPVILGLDGYYSRLDGMALIVAGGLFYYVALRDGSDGNTTTKNTQGRYKNFFLLLLSMAILLVGAHFTVDSATELAVYFKISPILIGMFIVGLGTTMPELFFSLTSVKKDDDALAVGDILGTVLADATIVVGILALMSPFAFPQKLIYVTGVFMVVAAFILFHFMRSGRHVTKKEAFHLLAFWVLFAVVEFFLNV